MLEGKAEQTTLRWGGFIADQLGYLRINRELWGGCRSFAKENSVPVSEFLVAIREAFRYSLKDPFSILSLPTFLLYRLTLGRLEPGLVSEITYWRHLHRVWGTKSRNVSDVKTLTRKLLDSDSIPDIGYNVNGHYFDKNWDRVQVQELIDPLGDSIIVVKRDYSERGRHVQMMPANELPAFNSKEFGDFVIQRKIHQHKFLDRFGNGRSVTLRLLTAFPEGKSNPAVISGLVKSDADPKSMEFLRIVIDPNTDTFVGFGVNAKWGRVPLENLGVTIHEEIPGLKKAKGLVLGLHSKFPHFQLIGWDIGIDETGKPWIFEWNADHPSIVFHQSVLGPVLARAGLDLTARAR
jgi:hypothetical protein